MLLATGLAPAVGCTGEAFMLCGPESAAARK
jgi:hypothetical protein